FKSGNHGISSVMRRLLTWYAQSFNRKHRRTGHLFENRFKSILCEEEAYLLALVRYVHLNHVRAKVVSSLEERAGVRKSELINRSRRGVVSDVREVVAHRCAEESGVSAAEIARRRGVPPSSITRAIARVEEQRGK
ncbi:MAG: hypothetical protein WCO26_20065, partial [Deltaproteobacteria bacterium]